jgi:hypothetical protein
MRFKQKIINSLVVIGFGLIPAIAGQFFVPEPSIRKIHISSFRYGKDPAVIKCNRGDTLVLSFSTKDTGHSFFLEEFDIDAKVSPGRETVELFSTQDPTKTPTITREVTLIAKHNGYLNYLVSKSNYRCHVWCGPMHAFEHGKIIITPNSLLIFSLGCSIGIFFLWIFSILFRSEPKPVIADEKDGYRDLMRGNGILEKIVVSRWPQTILIIISMMLVYVVILTSLFGTKMSGRNMGVLLMWAVWLFLLVALLTPFLGRIWCTICPLPFFGDLLQRNSVFNPVKGSKGEYKNKYSGFFLKWPQWLRNSWLKLFFLLILTTFSTTLVAMPKVTGFTVIALILLPTLLAILFEHRAFCRYLCPVSGFIGPLSRVSTLAIRNKSQDVCDKCKPHYCQKGSIDGWACPYGINLGELKESADCGLCLECTRSCLYNNVTIYSRPFGKELGTGNLSEAWLIISVFTMSVVYSILYLGHWSVIRDYINILDKGNWNLFAVYASMLWATALLIIPSILFTLSYIGTKFSKAGLKTKEVFSGITATLLPLGMMLWIAFVIPMLFVNVTFVLQSFSDPFGWGWDFFGTAGIPWHQFLPRAIPWLQAILVLAGLHFSLRNLTKTFVEKTNNSWQLFRLIMPMSLFLFAASVTMIFFYTN